MKFSSYISWQSTLTAHQYHTHLASAKALSTKCEFVSKSSEALGREKNHWRQEFDCNTVLDELSTYQKLRVIKAAIATKDALHVISSPFENLWQISIIFMLIVSRADYVVIMEAYNDTNHDYFNDRKLIGLLKKLARPLIYKYFYYYLLSPTLRIFAISPKCGRQLVNIGLDPQIISSFGYFIDTPNFKPKEKEHNDQLSFAYVGGSQARKGLNDLMTVWNKKAAQSAILNLDVYGPEKELPQDNVLFCGVIPFGSVPKYLQEYDAVIIPSNFDGWSLVVNEAISAGTFVIANEAVGASIIVRNCNVGITYSDNQELEMLLSDIESLKKRIRETPEENYLKANVLLTPYEAGHYFASELNNKSKTSALKDALNYDHF